MEKKQIWVGADTKDDVMLLKVQCKAKNAEAVIKKAIHLLKLKLEGEKNNESKK